MKNQDYWKLDLKASLSTANHESIDEETGKNLRKIISWLKDYKFEKHLSYQELSELIINRRNLQQEWSRDEVIELVKNNTVKEAFIEQRTLYLNLEWKLGASKKTTITSVKNLRLNFWKEIKKDTSESIQLANGFRIWTNDILTFSLSKNSLEMISKWGHYVSYSSLSTEDVNIILDVFRNKEIIELNPSSFLEKSNEVLIDKGIRIPLKP